MVLQFHPGHRGNEDSLDLSKLKGHETMVSVDLPTARVRYGQTGVRYRVRYGQGGVRYSVRYGQGGVRYSMVRSMMGTVRLMMNTV